jgi:hypothetical protein
MDEAGWLACQDPDPMLAFLRGQASERKLRLFGCACVRRVWDRLARAQAPRRAVELAEKFANRETTPEDLEAARLEAQREVPVASPGKEKNAVRSAAWCASGRYDALEIARSVSWGTAYAGRGGKGAARSAQAQLLRDIFGNPFRPPPPLPPAVLAWHDGTVVRLAQAM